jgi:hypothetical protein
MSLASTQVLSFENFGALEEHLRRLKNKYNDMIKSYEETLGFILRDAKPTSAKSQQVQEKWALEMQRALNTKSAANDKIVKKDESKPKLFGNGNGKDKDKPASAGEWISLDPMSLFIGSKNVGLAEIYFETINVLRENVIKINSALSVCSALKAKASSAGSISLIVSFINDIPAKVLIKSAKDSKSKKYTFAFSFAVPGMPVAAPSLILK